MRFSPEVHNREGMKVTAFHIIYHPEVGTQKWNAGDYEDSYCIITFYLSYF